MIPQRDANDGPLFRSLRGKTIGSICLAGVFCYVKLSALSPCTSPVWFPVGDALGTAQPHAGVGIKMLQRQRHSHHLARPWCLVRCTTGLDWIGLDWIGLD